MTCKHSPQLICGRCPVEVEHRTRLAASSPGRTRWHTATVLFEEWWLLARPAILFVLGVALIVAPLIYALR